MRHANGCLYFAQVAGGGPIKVGFSSNVRNRLASLATWCPYKIEFLHSMEAPKMAEVYCLERLRAHQLKGEWFHPHPDVIRFIEEIRATNEVAGVPDAPKTTYGAPKGKAVQTTFAKVIPRFWKTREELGSAMMLQLSSLGTRNALSEQACCRIILYARSQGVELKTADLQETVPEKPRPNRPYNPRGRTTKKYTRRSRAEMYPEAFVASVFEQSISSPSETRVVT